MLQRTISRENSSSNFHLSHLENGNICTCRAFLFLSLYCTVIVYLAWLCSDYPGQTRHNPLSPCAFPKPLAPHLALNP